MARRRIARNDKTGEFAKKSSLNRAIAQGGEDAVIKGEHIDYPDENTITSIDGLWDIYEDDSFDPEDFEELEFHGTGDTGRSGRR